MFSTEFLLTALVVVLVPGTGVIYTVSTGLTHQWRASLAAALGCTAGILPHLTASILGLSAILHMSARAFRVLKFIGTLYLLYLAWTMWRDTGSLKFDKSVSPAQQMIGLSAVFMGITFVIFALYGILASGISTHLIKSPKAIRRMQQSFAIIFAALAAKIALSEQ